MSHSCALGLGDKELGQIHRCRSTFGEGVIHIASTVTGINHIPVALLGDLFAVDVCRNGRCELTHVCTVKLCGDHLDFHAILFAFNKGVGGRHLRAFAVIPDHAARTAVHGIQPVNIGVGRGRSVIRRFACHRDIQIVDHHGGYFLRLAGKGSGDPLLGEAGAAGGVALGTHPVNAGGKEHFHPLVVPEGIALFRLDVNTGFVLMSGDKGLMIVNPIAFGQIKPTDAILI